MGFSCASCRKARKSFAPSSSSSCGSCFLQSLKSISGTWDPPICWNIIYIYNLCKGCESDLFAKHFDEFKWSQVMFSIYKWACMHINIGWHKRLHHYRKVYDKPVGMTCHLWLTQTLSTSHVWPFLWFGFIPSNVVSAPTTSVRIAWQMLQGNFWIFIWRSVVVHWCIFNV